VYFLKLNSLKLPSALTNRLNWTFFINKLAITKIESVMMDQSHCNNRTTFSRDRNPPQFTLNGLTE
jgi:hypothetical protein